MEHQTQTDGGAMSCIKPKPLMPVHRSASEYNMTHSKRGLVIIFSHQNFRNNSVKPRSGTYIDCKNLQDTFGRLQFDVEVCDNLHHHEILKKIGELSRADHSQHDCLLIAILSRGDLGRIHSYDKLYNLEDIMTPLTKCETLIGKPKLFFVEACEDELFSIESSAKERILGKRGIETDSSGQQPLVYKYPNYADFLIVHSSIPDAWDDSNDGSRFVQSLCQEFNEKGSKFELMALIAFLNQRVENMCKKTLCTTSTLTRILRFHAK